jgi:hypothetical protein
LVEGANAKVVIILAIVLAYTQIDTIQWLVLCKLSFGYLQTSVSYRYWTRGEFKRSVLIPTQTKYL